MKTTILFPLKMICNWIARCKQTTSLKTCSKIIYQTLKWKLRWKIRRSMMPMVSLSSTQRCALSIQRKRQDKVTIIVRLLWRNRCPLLKRVDVSYPTSTKMAQKVARVNMWICNLIILQIKKEFSKEIIISRLRSMQSWISSRYLLGLLQRLIKYQWVAIQFLQEIVWQNPR